MASYGLPFSRRGFLAVGVAGFGLDLVEFLALRYAQAAEHLYETPPVVAESIIHIFLPGGIAAQESWDPKPYAPIEYRGEMKAIPTKISGECLSELLPKCADIADKLTIVRSLTHGEAAHERGEHNMYT